MLIKHALKGTCKADSYCCCAYFDIADDGSVCYITNESAEQPPKLMKVNMETWESSVLMSYNPEISPEALGTSQLIEWRAADGEIRRGALMLPPGYVKGQTLPLIVDIYEGYQSISLNTFGFYGGFDNAHLYTGRGYAFLLPDLPLTEKDKMKQFWAQLAPAVNTLIDMKIVDPDRMGLLGHSYGGYGVMSILTQTDRFKTGVTLCGIVNLTSMYGTIQHGNIEPDWGLLEKGQFGLPGTLWDACSAFIENSPLFYMDRITSPVLLVAGTADVEDNNQAIEAYSALRRLGKKVELRRYRGQGHGLDGCREMKRDLFTRILEWFDTHLAKR
jgi:dipeptidyl aminopeptidase/acylaminoacyl peptidase